MADVSFRRTDEQQLLASTLRDLLGTTVDMDRTRELSLTHDALDRDTWDALVELGVVGLHLAEDVGGAGAPFTDVAVVFEELGRVVAAVPMLSTLMASMAIDRAGSDEQRRQWLPDLASGATIGTLAVSESAHGDPGSVPDTTAHRSPDGWHLTGTKRFVTDGSAADVLVVSAAVDGEPTLVVVPADADGVSITPQPALDATRPLAQVDLDVALPESALLPADGRSTLRSVIDHAVAALAAEQVGGAAWCLEAAVEYAGSRYQFGRAIGSFQAVKHRCADMLVAVEHARSAAWHAAASIDDPGEAAIMVPVAKSVCSEAFVQCSGDAIQIFGGIGFTWEHDAHLYFKRAKADSLLLGSVGSHRDRLASAIGV